MRSRARAVGSGVRQRGRAAGACALALAVLASTWGQTPAAAGPSDHKYLSVRGTVADSDGNPLSGVAVEASGTREARAVTGTDGRYQLSLDLGTLATLRDRPAAIWIRARLEGWRVHVAGGAPSLAIELSVSTSGSQPQMVARSNFGLIADAMLDALAPAGDRTASIQAVFVAQRGAAADSTAPLAAERRFAVLIEPWLMKAPVTAAEPAAPGLAAPVTKSAAPSPSAAARDSARRARDAEEHLKNAAAIAARESVWMAQRAVALAQRMLQDSLRAVRDAAEDSARRGHAAPAAAAAGASAKPAAPVKAAPSSQSAKPSKTSASPVAAAASPAAKSGAADHDKQRSSDPANVLPVRPRTSWSDFSGLTRVQPGGGRLDTVAIDVAGIPVTPGGAECSCRVKGTVELEFHHLLSSPMRVEVAIMDVPAMRDTVQLFMGSPRAFDFPNVPCGHLSIRISAFSQREFEVITPDQVAPFECRDGGLRQVRIVIAPR